MLVQYPRSGSWALGFVTNELRTTKTGSPQTMQAILIPQPPSPFTGPVIFVPERDVIGLDIPVEDAVKLIVSGGVVSPESLQATKPLTSS